MEESNGLRRQYRDILLQVKKQFKIIVHFIENYFACIDRPSCPLDFFRKLLTVGWQRRWASETASLPSQLSRQSRIIRDIFIKFPPQLYAWLPSLGWRDTGRYLCASRLARSVSLP
mgnify:CR=1 FL=1